MQFKIENVNNAGHYWSRHFKKFCSTFGDDQTVYPTYERARKAAEKLSSVYNVRIVEIILKEI